MTYNDALINVDRNRRRVLLRAEAIARQRGEWGEWETLTFPAGSCGRGWAREFTKAHRNKIFSVLDRVTNGETRHLAVASLSQIRPTWWEMQRIKDDLAGKEATAVEVYPPHDEIVDGADMFHIWVLSYRLPFGLKAPTPSPADRLPGGGQ